MKDFFIRINVRAALHFILAAIRHLFSIRDIRTALYYCRIYGFRSALDVVVSKLHVTPAREPLSLSEIIPLGKADGPNPLDESISIIIPTKNAGMAFEKLMRSLKSQKGLKEIELIVIDSGSTDETLAIARKECAKIMDVAPQEFHHAFTRNKAAEFATGDYILFLVQDAIPSSDNWLHEMARVLTCNEVAAVSCAESPREDCDLFYRCLMWNHYRSLYLDRDRILTWDASCTSPFGLRANSQISNVALLIRRNIFLNYKFKTEFAEDLELGTRLIRDGHRMGFLHTTRIVHSHNRPALYYLKRAYVEGKNWVRIFPNCTIPPVVDSPRLFRDISSLYFRTKEIAAAMVQDLRAGEILSIFMDRIKSLYSMDAPIPKRIAGTTDNDLESLIAKLYPSANGGSEYRYRRNALRMPLLNNLRQMHAYLSQSHDTVDESLALELGSALPKMVALNSGTHLAYLYLTLSRLKRPELFPAELDRTLCFGI